MSTSQEPIITVVGSSNMDLISYVDRFPGPGETITGSKFQSGFGGKGANQAVMAAKLGGKVNMITKVGKDMYGADTIKNYNRWNIATDFVYETDEVASGIAAITVTKDGENNIIIVPGANLHLTVEEVQKARDAIKGSKIMLTQWEVSREATKEALKIGREEGVITMLNTAPAPAESIEDLYPYIDILSLNEVELSQLSQEHVSDVSSAETAARILIKKGVKSVLVTLGTKGSVFVPTEGSIIFVEARKVKAIDTTGAGDCFLGTFAYYYAKEGDIRSGMKKAAFVASLSVQKEGTQSSYPLQSELPPFE